MGGKNIYKLFCKHMIEEKQQIISYDGLFYWK